MRIALMAIIVAGFANLVMAQDAQQPKKVRKTVTPTTNTTTQEPTSAIGMPAKISVRFIELKVDANGKGSLHVDCQTNSEAHITPPKGVTSKLALLNGASIMRLPDGRTEVLHDFATFANVGDFISETQSIDAFALDKERGGLLLKPIEVPGHQGKKAALFWYPRPVRLPVALRIVVANLESDPFCIELQFRHEKYAKLNVYFFTDAKKPLGLQVSWFDAAKGNVLNLINSDLPVDGEVTYGFKCPIDAEHQNPTPYFARGNREMTLCQLDVTANFIARIGVKFADRKGQVVVESVFEGPATKAGVRPGDVVSQIDHKPIANSEAALRLVRNHNPGDTLQLTISREGDTLTIPVIAE
ncbi:MAG: PDZ domain-containing protein [Victivallales bacterium]|jgi:hypothetical protein